MKHTPIKLIFLLDLSKWAFTVKTINFSSTSLCHDKTYGDKSKTTPRMSHKLHSKNSREVETVEIDMKHNKGTIL
jgi:hypothetical protein